MVSVGSSVGNRDSNSNRDSSSDIVMVIALDVIVVVTVV